MKVTRVIRFGITALLVVLFCVIGIAGIAIGRYDIFPFWQQAEKGMDIEGSTALVFSANDSDKISADELNAKMAQTLKVIRIRLDLDGYSDATLVREGYNTLRVEVPVNDTTSVTSADSLITYLSNPGKLEFDDPAGNLIVDYNHIKTVEAVSPTTDTYGLAVTFDTEGQKIFAEKSQQLINQTITLKQDGSVIASVKLTEAVTNGTIRISGGSFTAKKSQEMALQSKTEPPQLSLTLQQYTSTSGSLGINTQHRLIKSAVLGMAIVCLLLLIFYRLPGLILDLSLILYTVLMLFFLAAFQMITTMATLGGILFGFMLAVLMGTVGFERARNEMKIGKSLKASLETGFKSNFWLLLLLLIAADIAVAVFGGYVLNAFALSMMLSVIAAFVGSWLFTRYMLRVLLDFNITKRWLYFSPFKGRKEVA